LDNKVIAISLTCSEYKQNNITPLVYAKFIMSLNFQRQLVYKNMKRETSIACRLTSCLEVSVLPRKQTSLAFACKFHRVWISIIYIIIIIGIQP